MCSNELVTDSVVRQRTAKFVTAVLEASKMNANELKKAIGATGSGHIYGYMSGKFSPSIEKMISMYELTGINPAAFGLPIVDAMKCVERMRDMFREGHTISEFSKALRPICSGVISKLIGGHMVTAITLLRFHYYWYANNVEKLVQDIEFRASCIRKEPSKQRKNEVEFQYILKHWGALSESAHENSSGLWEWFTDSLYRMELERLHGNTYEFRAFLKATGDISVKREVIIA